MLKPYAWGSAKEPLVTYPSPNPTLTLQSSIDCCWVRGGVGWQLFRYWYWSQLSRYRNWSDFRIKDVLDSHLLIYVKGDGKVSRYCASAFQRSCLHSHRSFENSSRVDHGILKDLWHLEYSRWDTKARQCRKEVVIGKKTAMMTSYTTSSQQTLIESESEE